MALNDWSREEFMVSLLALDRSALIIFFSIPHLLSLTRPLSLSLPPHQIGGDIALLSLSLARARSQSLCSPLFSSLALARTHIAAATVTFSDPHQRRRISLAACIHRQSLR